MNKKKPKRGNPHAKKAHAMKLLRERGRVVWDMLQLLDTSEDYQALSKRLEDLNAEIESLETRV